MMVQSIYLHEDDEHIIIDRNNDGTGNHVRPMRIKSHSFLSINSQGSRLNNT